MSSTMPTLAAAPVGLSDARATDHAHPAYRPDIDGLRAVAVLAVIGFHAFSWSVPGGFVGVDIFFVISGYLITTIILGNLRDGDFSYLDFYARRIRRIFPALIVVVAAAWIVGWFRLFPDQYRQLGKHIAAGAGFVSNLVLRKESGYFDTVAEAKPLLHLWSLAIEEQFYIFWPLILAVSIRRFASVWTIVAIALASFAFNLSTLGMEPTLAFYSPLSRFWELMIGGLLAQRMHSRPRSFERFGNLRSVAGFGLIAVAIAGFSRALPYPGWRALLPTIGAFLVISAGPRAWLNRMVLSNRIAVWFGKISYPLYLWHWPLLSFVYIERSDQIGRGTRIGLVAASVALAWLTYRFVETPIRRSANAQALPAALFATLAVVGAVGYATLVLDGITSRQGERGEYAASFDNSLPDMAYSARHAMSDAFREECNFYDLERWREGRSTDVPRPAIHPNCTARAAGTTRAVFVWGDSHAEHLNFGLREALPTDVALLQVASSACWAELVEPDRPAESFCLKSNQVALAAIRREKPDVVVIAQREGHRLQRLRAIAIQLKKDGVRQVIVVGPIPQWKPDLNKVIASHYWGSTPDRLTSHLDPEIVGLNRQLEAGLGPDEPFVFVDLFASLCDPRGCRTYLDGDRREGLMTFDYGHLTPRSSSFVGRTVLGPMLVKLLESR